MGGKLAVFAGFLGGLWMLIFSGGGAEETERGLLGLLVFLMALAQLWMNHPGTWQRSSRLLLVFTVLLVHLWALRWMLGVVEAGAGVDGVLQGGAAGVFTSTERQQLWRLGLPLAFAPLTLSVLLGKNHGASAALFVSLWSSVICHALDARLLVMSLITGFLAVFGTIVVRRRATVVRAGLLVGVGTWVLGVLFGWIGPVNWHALGSTPWGLIGWQTLVAVGGAMLLAFVVGGGVVPMCEALFGITTEMSWMELADLNHPLLKRMTIEAPGTYHHSLVVASLAERAAEAVGANASMARVCAYFHDIGKLVKPEYFAENFRNGRNPHDELAPTMSALIILAHVKEGVDLGLKHRLNREIIDVIQQHHGTSLAYYFYQRALQQQEDMRAGGKIMNIREEDVPEVREETFRYGGPRPQTRECAVINLADAVESASRSLDRVSPQRLEQLIRDIFQRKIADGQLSECELSLRELEVVAESFVFTLQSMMHSRVAYPSERGEKQGGSAVASKSSAPRSAA